MLTTNLEAVVRLAQQEQATSPGANASAGAPEAETTATLSAKPKKLDLANLIAHIKATSADGRIPDYKKLAEFELSLASMNTSEVGELLAGLQGAAGLSENEKREASSRLLEVMAQTDASLALDAALIVRRSSETNPAQWNQTFVTLLKKFVKQDVAKAEAWLDLQINIHAFGEGGSSGADLPKMLEGSLVQHALGTNAELAIKRLTSLGKDAYSVLGSQLGSVSVSPEARTQVVQVLRSLSLTTGEQQNALSQYGDSIARKHGMEVVDFIRNTASSPQERQAMVQQASGAVLRRLMDREEPLTEWTRWMQAEYQGEVATEIAKEFSSATLVTDIAAQQLTLASPPGQADEVRVAFLKVSGSPKLKQAVYDSLESPELKQQMLTYLERP
jgi:hypothetical protein